MRVGLRLCGPPAGATSRTASMPSDDSCDTTRKALPLHECGCYRTCAYGTTGEGSDECGGWKVVEVIELGSLV
jgi:hypothetical protein